MAIVWRFCQLTTVLWAIALTLTGIGCSSGRRNPGKSGAVWPVMKVFVEKDSLGNCTVTFYGAPKPPDGRVMGLWDGNLVFDHPLPERKSGPDGWPLHLAKIRTPPGRHRLKVRYGGKRVVNKVVLSPGEERYFMIFSNSSNSSNSK